MGWRAQRPRDVERGARRERGRGRGGPRGPARVSVPAVSVVIPCHNAEAWIGETIASVAIQEGVAVEAIVVDDGSEDASADAARAAAGHLPLAIIRHPQRG